MDLSTIFETNQGKRLLYSMHSLEQWKTLTAMGRKDPFWLYQETSAIFWKK